MLAAGLAAGTDPRCQCVDSEADQGRPAQTLCGEQGATKAERNAFCAEFGAVTDRNNCDQLPSTAGTGCAWATCIRHRDCAIGTFCSTFGGCTPCGNAPTLGECETYAIDHDCCTADLLVQCPTNFDRHYLAACDVPCVVPGLDTRASPTVCRAVLPPAALQMSVCQYVPLDCREQHDVHCCRYDDSGDCVECSPVNPPRCGEGEELPDSALSFSVHTVVESRFASTTIVLRIVNARRCIAEPEYVLELPLEARIDAVDVAPSDNSRLSSSTTPGLPAANLTAPGPWDSAHYVVRAAVPSSGSTVVEIRYHHPVIKSGGVVSLALPLAPQPSTQPTDGTVTLDESAALETFAIDRSVLPIQTSQSTDEGRREVQFAVAPTKASTEARFVDGCAALFDASDGESAFVESPDGDCVPRTKCPARQLRTTFGVTPLPEVGALLDNGLGSRIWVFSPPSLQDEECNDPPMARNLVMVMDVSSIMGGRRLNDTKRMFLSLLHANSSLALNESDAVGFRTFAEKSTEASWGPKLLTDKHRAELVAFVEKIRYGEYLDTVVPRYVGRDLNGAYVEGLQMVDKMMNREVGAPIDFTGAKQAACKEKFGKGCADKDAVPMLLVVTAGNATRGVSDPHNFTAAVREANRGLDAKIVSVALGQGADVSLMSTVTRQNCGAFAQIHDDRSDTVSRMEGFINSEMAIPLLFNVTMKAEGAELEGPACSSRVLLRGSELVLPYRSATTAQLNFSVTGRGAVGRKFSKMASVSPAAAPTLSARAGARLLAYARVQELLSWAEELRLLGEMPSMCHNCWEECGNATDPCVTRCVDAGDATNESACELTGNTYLPELRRRAGSRSIPADCTNGGNASSRDLCERTGFVFIPPTNRSLLAKLAATEVAQTGLPGGGGALWHGMSSLQISSPEGSKVHTPLSTYLQHIVRYEASAPNVLPPVRPPPPPVVPDPIYPPPRPPVDWLAFVLVTLCVTAFLILAYLFQVLTDWGWFKRGLPQLPGIQRQELLALLISSGIALNSGVYCMVASCRIVTSILILLVGVVIISVAASAAYKKGEVLQVVCPRTGIDGSLIRVDREGRWLKNYYREYPTEIARRHGPTSMDVTVPPGLRKGDVFEVRVDYAWDSEHVRHTRWGIHVPSHEHACGNRIGRLLHNIRRLARCIYHAPRNAADKVCDCVETVIICFRRCRHRNKVSDAYAESEEEEKVLTVEEAKAVWMRRKKKEFLAEHREEPEPEPEAEPEPDGEQEEEEEDGERSDESEQEDRESEPAGEESAEEGQDAEETQTEASGSDDGSLSGKEGSSGSDSEPDEDELLELGWDQEAAEEEWLESEEYEKAEANRKRLKAQSDIRKLATLGRFLVAHEGPVPEGAAADQQEGKGAVFDPALATLDAETSYSMDTNEK